MMYEELFTFANNPETQCCDDFSYDPNKPRIKAILWDHYEWFVEMDKAGKARKCVLDNVQKTLLCNTIYLGFDVFECPHCSNEMVFNRKCHCRFCTSCGIKYQKQLAIKAETMCVDTPHRHIVFTIPEEYRPFFRRDRNALNLLFVAARNTICKITNESLYRRKKRKIKNKSQKSIISARTNTCFHNASLSESLTDGQFSRQGRRIEILIRKKRSVYIYIHTDAGSDWTYTNNLIWS